MPDDFRPRVKSPKNSEPNVKSQIDENKSAETKKLTKKKKLMCFGLIFLTILVIPAACVPILFVQKRNVTVNNVTVNNVQVDNVEVKNKGFAQKKIIKDGKEYFVMTKKQVKLIAQKSALTFNSIANGKYEKKKVSS